MVNDPNIWSSEVYVRQVKKRLEPRYWGKNNSSTHELNIYDDIITEKILQATTHYNERQISQS